MNDNNIILRICLLCFLCPWLLWLTFWRHNTTSTPVGLIGDSHLAELSKPSWINRARRGQTVKQLLPILKSQLLDMPPIIILSIGANDISAGRDFRDVEEETRIAADMIAMSGRTVIIAEMPVPRNTDLLPANINKGNYARFIWVTQAGYRFCPVPGELKDLGGALDITVTDDGQHFNQVAQGVWQRQLADCVRQAEGKP